MSSAEKAPIVLFIGLTQNGKSSAIRSILQFAGDEEQAAKVERGHDSLSTTKDVTEYPILIPRKDFHLRYKDGRGRVRLVDEDLEKDEVELEECSSEYSSNSGMWLKLLDSPGLSDSGTPASKISGDKKLPLNMEDEKHKLEVLSALSDLGKINSVCFVVKRGNQFGWDFQQHIAAYRDIFRISSLAHIKFHVLHTQIDLPYRFKTSNDEDEDSDGPAESVEGELWTARRAKSFRELTGIDATHHWMDNQPSIRNPIAQYFSKKAISQLIIDLQKDRSIPCTELRYPKGELHKVCDKQLRTSYDSLVFRLQSEKRRLATEVADLERALRPKLARRSGFKSEIDALDSKIQVLDSSELEKVGNDDFYKPATIDNWAPTLYFRIEATATIREIIRNPENPTNAKWIVRESKNDHYYADYQADVWSSAKASILLKGYKRDVNAKELQNYKKQRDGFQDDVAMLNVQITPIERDINLNKLRSHNIDLEILILKSEITKLQGTSFSLQSFKDKSGLFLSGRLYSIFQAYGLNTMALKSYLPRHHLSKKEVNTELWTLKREQSRTAQAAKKVLDALQQDLKRKSDLMKELQDLFDKTRGHRDVVEGWIEATNPHKTTQDGTTELSADFETAIDELQDKCNKYNKIFERIFGLSYLHFDSNEKWIAEALGRIKELVAKSAEAVDEYTKIERRLLSNVKAVTMTMDVLKTDSISIGAFTVLFKAIEKKVSNPFMELYEEIAAFLGEECPESIPHGN